MKAVFFAGGLGTRMGQETLANGPKPMVELGGRPLIVHLMQIFARQGVSQFVILAGYRSNAIKDFFLNFRGAVSDVKIELSTGHAQYASHQLTEYDDWSVEILDTGVSSSTERRLHQAKHVLQGQDFFLTYGDGLANVNLASLTQEAQKSPERVATLTSFRPPSRFGILETASNGEVNSFREKPVIKDLINIGFMYMKSSIWDYVSGDDVQIEEGLLPRLAQNKLLGHYHHQGFWQPMDTPRELNALDEHLKMGGTPPWLRGI